MTIEWKPCSTCAFYGSDDKARDWDMCMLEVRIVCADDTCDSWMRPMVWKQYEVDEYGNQTEVNPLDDVEIPDSMPDDI